MTATKSSKSESPAIARKGIPTMSGMEHIGLCVPNLDEAIAYFCDIIGCEFLYRHGPYVDHSDGPNNFYTKYVGLHARTKTDIAMLRCGNGSNLELFEMEAPGQKRKVPPFSDHGGAHFCFYVDDMDAAVEYLVSKGVKVMGGASKITAGPEAGVESASTHFETPWGQMLEVISYPHGREYEKQTKARLWIPNKPDTWY